MITALLMGSAVLLCHYVEVISSAAEAEAAEPLEKLADVIEAAHLMYPPLQYLFCGTIILYHAAAMFSMQNIFRKIITKRLQRLQNNYSVDKIMQPLFTAAEFLCELSDEIRYLFTLNADIPG